VVARQLDADHVVIRTKHMMVVADVEHGNADAVEDAVIDAWELQRSRGRG